MIHLLKNRNFLYNQIIGTFFFIVSPMGLQDFPLHLIHALTQLHTKELRLTSIFTSYIIQSHGGVCTLFETFDVYIIQNTLKFH